MRRWISGVLFIVSLVLLSISIYFLMGMFREYKQADELNGKLQQIHEAAAQTEETVAAPTPWPTSRPFVTPAPEETPAVESEEDTTEQTAPTREVDAGLLTLHEENSDCIYWLTIPDTVIDYPVMYNYDPYRRDYYLNRDFNGKYSDAGLLYIDNRCPADGNYG